MEEYLPQNISTFLNQIGEQVSEQKTLKHALLLYFRIRVKD